MFNNVNQFKNVIEDIVDSTIDKKRISRYVSAIVESINVDGSINVYIPPDMNNKITGLLNKTNESLSIGDSVEICTKNGKVNNAWVSIKHGTNVAGGGSVPSGGTTNQVLAKNSNSDYDLKWTDAGSGSGDMLKSTYDPTNKNADAFSMANMVESSTNKIFTSSERTKLGGIEAGAQVNTIISVNGQTGTVSLDADDINDSTTTKKFVSSGDLVNLSNLSGINTGDETNSTIKTKLGSASSTNDGYLISNDWNTFNSKQNTLVSGTNIKTINNSTLLGSGNINLQTPLTAGTDYLIPNATITGATKTKITYDSKGLVVSGSDATTADIASSTDKRYLTDAQLLVVGNTSGTNTGDETTSSIKTKLGASSSTSDGYLSSSDWNVFNNKQSTLISGTNIKTINGNSLLGVGNLTIESQNAIDVTVTTANATAAKIGTTSGGTYVPSLGSIIRVTFTLGCNVSNPTLNIDGSGAKNIRLGNINATTAFIATTSAITILMWYDGTYYQMYGSLKNDNTTYSEITEAEIDAGTATTLRTFTGRRAKYMLDKKQNVLISGTNIKTINGSGLLGSEDILLQTPLTIATGTDINTGTDNVKYVTSKAIKDSNLVNSTDGSVTDIQSLTQAEYDALSQIEKDTGTYLITDDLSGAINVVNGFTSTSVTDPGSANNDKLLNDKINGTILYDNSTGTTGTVTLSDSLANYSKIEIEFYSTTISTKYKTEVFLNPNGKTLLLEMTMPLSNVSFIRLESVTYNASTTTLTRVEGAFVNIYTGVINANGTGTTFNITKVIGYKNN